MPRRSSHGLHHDEEPIPINVTRESRTAGPQGGDGATAEAAEISEIDSLKARIAELEKQVEDEKNAHLRALADYQNYRRRSDEQRREAQQFANRELVLGLLPALDNFERALAAAEKNQSYDALIGGVSLTMRQIQDYLAKNGVEPIEAVGKEFDPNFHEAVMRVEDSEHPENTVVEEVQKGYKMHN